MERFKAKCVFDPTTGCVLWQGALSNGKDSTSIYGRFWFEGKSWAAHRWAAQFIHGIDLRDGHHVDHCCKDAEGRPRPNTLCVQHVQQVTSAVNLALRWSRFWQYWCGDYGEELEEEAASSAPPADAIPFHVEPDWLKTPKDGNDDECPF